MKALYKDALKFIITSFKVEIIATEVKTAGGFVADILALQNKGVCEYEIKASVNDLHNEKKAKAKKHTLYAQFEHNKRRLPQYYTLIMPDSLLSEYARIGEINDKYGIISYRLNNGVYSFKNEVIASKLNSGKGTPLVREITRRMVFDYHKHLGTSIDTNTAQ